MYHFCFLFFFSSRRRHTRSLCDWSSDVCSSDLSWRPPPQRIWHHRSKMCEQLERFRRLGSLRRFPLFAWMHLQSGRLENTAKAPRKVCFSSPGSSAMCPGTNSLRYNSEEGFALLSGNVMLRLETLRRLGS